MKTLIQRAYDLAAYAHSNQRRKYTGDLYIVHPANVAIIVATVTSDEEAIAAAYCHDVVEDTNITLEVIEDQLGKGVARLVAWLTDVSTPQHGNRATRKELDRAHLSLAPATAQTIKLADLIDNTGSIVKHDPDFAKVYLAEKNALLNVLHKGDRTLWVKADNLLIESMEKLYGTLDRSRLA